MPTYLCSRTPKGENSERIDDEEEFGQVFQTFADSETDEVLRFEFNKRYYVEIAHARNKGSFLECFHEKHVFETLVPFDGVKTGFTIEEFLEDFWHHRVRQKYNFEEDTQGEHVYVRNPNLTARFRLRLAPLVPLLPFILPAVLYFGLFGTTQDIPAAEKLAWGLLLITMPYWILYLRHLFHSITAKVQISQQERLITFTRGSVHTSIRFSEITQIRIIKNSITTPSRSGPLLGRWSYMRIVAGPHKRIVISDLLHEDLENIARRIGKDPVLEPSLFPFLLQKKKSAADVAEEEKEAAEKGAELEVRWANKTREQLEEVIRNAEQYSAFAVEAAKRLLNKK
jgi:hypothetical protein